MNVLKCFLAVLLISFELAYATSVSDEKKESQYSTLGKLEQFANTIMRAIVGTRKEDVWKSILLYRNMTLNQVIRNYWWSLNHRTAEAALLAVGGIFIILSVFTAGLLYWWTTGRKIDHGNIVCSVKEMQCFLLFQINKIKAAFIALGLILSVGLLLMGTVLIIKGSEQLKEKNVELFQILNTTSLGMYFVKQNFLYRLSEIQNEIQKAIHKNKRELLKFSEKVIGLFKRNIRNVVNPVFKEASDIDSNFLQLYKSTFSYMVYAIQLIKRTQYFEEFLIIFNKSLDFSELQKENAEFAKTLTMLKRKAKAINMTDVAEKLKTLWHLLGEDVKILDLGVKFSHTNYVYRTVLSMFRVPMELNIDPTVIVENVKGIGTNVTNRWEKHLTDLTDFLHWLFPFEKDEVLLNVKEIKSNANFVFEQLHRVLSAIVIVALSLLFPIIVGTFIGLAGTKMFRRCDQQGYSKNSLSDSGGNILEAGLYIASLFVSVFLIISFLFFAASLISTDICLSLENMSVVDAPMKNFENNHFNDTLDIYHNKTLIHVLEICKMQEDNMKRLAIEDLLPPSSHIGTKRLGEMLTALKLRSEKGFSEVPLININRINITIGSALALSTSINERRKLLHNLLFNLSSSEGDIKSIKKGLGNLSSYHDLTPLTVTKLENSKNSYEELSTAFHSIENKIHILADTCDSYDMFLIIKIIDGIQDLSHKSKKLNHFILQNASTLLVQNVKYVANESVEGFMFSLEHIVKSILHFECKELASVFYRIITFACEFYLNTIYIICFGVILTSAFFFTTVLISIPVVWAFKIPMKRKRSSRKTETSQQENQQQEEVYDLSRRRRAANVSTPLLPNERNSPE